MHQSEMSNRSTKQVFALHSMAVWSEYILPLSPQAASRGIRNKSWHYECRFLCRR